MDNIDKMAAGRELDALVAEKVLILEVVWANSIIDWQTVPRPQAPFIKGTGKEIEHYSTDIAAAWKVVGKFRNAGRAAGVHYGNVSRHWVCIISGSVREGNGPKFHMAQDGYGEGDTAPLAICRAALKAVGVAVYARN